MKTDGELINFVRFRCYPMGIIESISNKLIVKRFGNWKSVFSTYFVDEEHPNNKLARKANI